MWWVISEPVVIQPCFLVFVLSLESEQSSEEPQFRIFALGLDAYLYIAKFLFQQQIYYINLKGTVSASSLFRLGSSLPAPLQIAFWSGKYNQPPNLGRIFFFITSFPYNSLRLRRGEFSLYICCLKGIIQIKQSDIWKQIAMTITCWS